MRGKYRIQIQNQNLHYDFEIKRNITIIRGDSATGKTTLVDMVREFYENESDSGIDLKCEVACAVLEGRNWKNQLESFRNSILFIDEGNRFVASREFAEAVQGAENYFVLVTRESLPMLPYSVEEIYGIRNSGKYGTLKRTYQKLYQLYGNVKAMEKVKPQMLITEDSNSGFQFFDGICKRNQIPCISAEGKSNLFASIIRKEIQNALVIADGAAIGSEMERLMKVVHRKPEIRLFLPESFEWLILRADVLKDKEVREILESPYDFADSREYLSWERFFTALLTEKTKGTYLEYSKSRLNPAYGKGMVAERIEKSMERIAFSEQQGRE